MNDEDGEFYGFTLKVCLFKHLVITIHVCEAGEMQLWNETGANWLQNACILVSWRNKMDSHKIADGRKSLEMVSRSLIERRSEKDRYWCPALWMWLWIFYYQQLCLWILVRKPRLKFILKESTTQETNNISFGLIHWSISQEQRI